MIKINSEEKSIHEDNDLVDPKTNLVLESKTFNDIFVSKNKNNELELYINEEFQSLITYQELELLEKLYTISVEETKTYSHASLRNNLIKFCPQLKPHLVKVSSSGKKQSDSIFSVTIGSAAPSYKLVDMLNLIKNIEKKSDIETTSFLSVKDVSWDKSDLSESFLEKFMLILCSKLYTSQYADKNDEKFKVVKNIITKKKCQTPYYNRYVGIFVKNLADSPLMNKDVCEQCILETDTKLFLNIIKDWNTPYNLRIRIETNDISFFKYISIFLGENFFISNIDVNYLTYRDSNHYRRNIQKFINDKK